MSETEFHGAKIAVLVRGGVLSLLRDDIPSIPWPGRWDLPGGARDGREPPLTTALREMEEELGLTMDPVRIAARRFYDAPRRAWFFVAYWPELDLGRVRFGDEGQGWTLMPVGRFLTHPKGIPSLQARLAAYLSGADPASSD